MGRPRLHGPGLPDPIEETLARGDTVVVLGRAEGSFSSQGSVAADNGWSAPVAWRVKVDGDRVALWQVYVNPEAMTRMLGCAGSS